MAKTSLIIETTDTLGKKIQKTFTDVNPEATSTELKTFAQMCVGLTNDTYVRTDRIDKTNCDTEDSGKDTPTLTLDSATSSVSSVDSGTWIEISYSGDADIKDFFVTFDTDDTNILAGVVNYDNAPNLWLKKGAPSIAIKPCVITLHTPETDNYRAASVTLTVTA